MCVAVRHVANRYTRYPVTLLYLPGYLLTVKHHMQYWQYVRLLWWGSWPAVSTVCWRVSVWCWRWRWVTHQWTTHLYVTEYPLSSLHWDTTATI